VDVDILGQTPEQAAKAVAAVEADFQRMHREWHAWKPGGELMELNLQIAAGGTLGVSPFLLPLLEQSQVLYRDSYGLYNPAIGGLIGLWGFHNDEPPAGPPPPASAIEALVQARPGMDDLQIEGDVVRSRNPVVQLDFGGFAKGYALSHAIERLRGFGIDNAIVNAPWHIGIRHPQGQGVLASIDIDDGECVMTSGNYERYREYEGVRYAHILDPRSGQPVRHVASATVIHSDGGKADAAATALTVAGPKDWERIAGRMGLRYVMLVDEEGRVYMSPAMAERVRFLEQRPEVITVGEAPNPDTSPGGPKK
jgi:thiamine biosynthesis lipoprotein